MADGRGLITDTLTKRNKKQILLLNSWLTYLRLLCMKGSLVF